MRCAPGVSSSTTGPGSGSGSHRTSTTPPTRSGRCSRPSTRSAVVSSGLLPALPRAGILPALPRAGLLPALPRAGLLPALPRAVRLDVRPRRATRRAVATRAVRRRIEVDAAAPGVRADPEAGAAVPGEEHGEPPDATGRELLGDGAAAGDVQVPAAGVVPGDRGCTGCSSSRAFKLSAAPGSSPVAARSKTSRSSPARCARRVTSGCRACRAYQSESCSRSRTRASDRLAGGAFTRATARSP